MSIQLLKYNSINNCKHSGVLVLVLFNTVNIYKKNVNGLYIWYTTYSYESKRE